MLFKDYYEIFGNKFGIKHFYIYNNFSADISVTSLIWSKIISDYI
jgi:hypothetical protein